MSASHPSFPFLSFFYQSFYLPINLPCLLSTTYHSKPITYHLSLCLFLFESVDSPSSLGTTFSFSLTSAKSVRTKTKYSGPISHQVYTVLWELYWWISEGVPQDPLLCIQRSRVVKVRTYETVDICMRKLLTWVALCPHFEIDRIKKHTIVFQFK